MSIMWILSVIIFPDFFETRIETIGLIIAGLALIFSIAKLIAPIIRKKYIIKKARQSKPKLPSSIYPPIIYKITKSLLLFTFIFILILAIISFIPKVALDFQIVKDVVDTIIHRTIPYILILCLFTFLILLSLYKYERQLFGETRQNLDKGIFLELNYGIEKITYSKAKKIITYYLDALIKLMSLGIHRKIPRIFKKKYGPKVAFVLLPDFKIGKYHIVYYCSSCDLNIYEGVIKKHKPSFYYKEKFNNLLILHELYDVAKKKEEIKDMYIRFKKNMCSSIGYIFSEELYDEITPKIKKCPIFDKSYIEHIPKDKKKYYAFRSMYAVPLNIKHIKLGILAVLDTLEGGFYPADQVIIRIIANNITKIIYMGMKRGLYQRIVSLKELEKPKFECPVDITKKLDLLSSEIYRKIGD